jgi:hypothetical protein
MFRFRLFSAVGADLRDFVTAVPNWHVGDTFTTGDGRHFWIVAIVTDVDPDLPVMALCSLGLGRCADVAAHGRRGKHEVRIDDARDRLEDDVVQRAHRPRF